MQEQKKAPSFEDALTVLLFDFLIFYPQNIRLQIYNSYFNLTRKKTINRRLNAFNCSSNRHFIS